MGIENWDENVLMLYNYFQKFFVSEGIRTGLFPDRVCITNWLSSNEHEQSSCYVLWYSLGNLWQSFQNIRVRSKSAAFGEEGTKLVHFRSAQQFSISSHNNNNTSYLVSLMSFFCLKTSLSLSIPLAWWNNSWLVSESTRSEVSVSKAVCRSCGTVGSKNPTTTFVHSLIMEKDEITHLYCMKCIK